MTGMTPRERLANVLIGVLLGTSLGLCFVATLLTFSGVERGEDWLRYNIGYLTGVGATTGVMLYFTAMRSKLEFEKGRAEGIKLAGRMLGREQGDLIDPLILPSNAVVTTVPVGGGSVHLVGGISASALQQVQQKAP